MEDLRQLVDNVVQYFVVLTCWDTGIVKLLIPQKIVTLHLAFEMWLVCIQKLYIEKNRNQILGGRCKKTLNNYNYYTPVLISLQLKHFQVVIQYYHFM